MKNKVTEKRVCNGCMDFNKTVVDHENGWCAYCAEQLRIRSVTEILKSIDKMAKLLAKNKEQ